MGKTIGPSLENQMRIVHGKVLGKDANIAARPAGPREPNPVKHPTYRVIIDTAIAANADPLGEPPGSTTIDNCTVLERNTATNRYRQTKRRLALSNESEEAYAADDAAWAVWQDGRYIVTGCPVPISDRPAPPWEEAE